jgi:alpha,alpha-trehalase
MLACLERLRPSVIKPANEFIKHSYCIPGGFYDQQWDWDGFFIASHLAARTPPQPQYLKWWSLNVLASVLPDGDVAACISPEGPRAAHPSLRLKPFLAQGAELAARLLDDYGWIEENYDEIVRISTRREATHFIKSCGLYAWDDAMQSGADNNPAIGNDPAAARTVAACDMNALLYREYLALARLAERLGRPDEQAGFAAKAAALRHAVNEHLWDATAESYWNLNAVTGQWCRRVSYSNFVPLWAGMVPAGRAQAMIRHYLWSDAHLLTPYGIRSLSRQDPDYNNLNMIIPFSNWQGPVWPIANYFYFVAMMNYGFCDEAAELVRRLTKLYLNDIGFCGSLHENYCAETGQPLAPSASQSKHGQEGGFLGWNLLLQDMTEMLDGRPNLLELGA